MGGSADTGLGQSVWNTAVTGRDTRCKALDPEADDYHESHQDVGARYLVFFGFGVGFLGEGG